MAFDENGQWIPDDEFGPTVAAAERQEQTQMTSDERARARYIDQQRRRMDAQNAQQGYRSVRTQGGVIDYQRPNFNSDEEYQQFARTARITDDLQRRIAVKRQEQNGMVLGYTREQKDQLAYLEKARANLYSKAGTWSPEQMQRADDLIQSKKDSILPSYVPKPPTPQQELQQRLISDGRGGQWIKDAKTGKFTQVREFASLDEIAKVHAGIKKKMEETDSYDPEKAMQDTMDVIQASVKIRAALAGDGPQPDPEALAAQRAQAQKLAAFSKEIRRSKIYGELPTQDEMAEKGRAFAQGAPNKAQEFMDMWGEAYKKDSVHIPDPAKFKIEKLLVPQGKSMGRKVVDVLGNAVAVSVPLVGIARHVLGGKTPLPPPPVYGEKFAIGQPAVRNGKTWHYIGNGKWSDQ